ncbi:MAG TPA: hypothetical protein PL009_05180 [Flavipsychrobacter sp.]|nr:hypothetical protein [Flavipsychrobacter sp.]
MQLIVLLTTCCFIFLPWQLYIFKTFPAEAKWEASFNFKHITEGLDEQTGPFYYFIEKIRINYGELIYLPLTWFLWKTCKNFRDKKLLAITIWVMVPLIFFSIAKTKMQAYILFISPALFLMTSNFFFMLNDYRKSHRLKWLFNLILFLLIVLPVRYMIERVKPFEKNNRNPDWVVELRELNDKKIIKGVLLNYDKPVEAMFYTDLMAYPYIPDKNKIVSLITLGYSIIINDKGTLPEEIKSIKGITIMKLKSE